MRNYGAPMHAAPLDGRDDSGDGSGGGSGPDGHVDGGVSELSRRLPAAAGLVGVLVALVAGLWLLSLTGDGGTGSQGSDPQNEEPFEAPTTSSPLREPDDTVEVAPEAEEPAGAPPAEPFSGLDGRLVYLSGSQVARVDLSTGALELLPINATESPLQIADLEFLSDGKRTVGIRLTDDPPTVVLVASRAVVVPAAHPMVDYWVVTRPEGPNGLMYMAGWQSYSSLAGHLMWVAEAPPGTELVTGGESGVLVVPPVGSTFQPTVSGFEITSDHRALANRGNLLVEQRCDEKLACTVVFLDGDTGEARDLPRDFVDELHQISISPDGRWLLNDTSPAWLFDLDTEELRLLDVGGYGRPQWSEDSASVAWLTTDRTPTLVVTETEPPEGEDGSHLVELAGLGADPSPGTTFLLDSTLNLR
ncbi:MAG: hypothetical protein F4072_07690 [Acidimicrobiaceae bacterium]|nr:hypothetical protein [Acidimicrobiaceae bacterium]